MCRDRLFMHCFVSFASIFMAHRFKGREKDALSTKAGFPIGISGIVDIFLKASERK